MTVIDRISKPNLGNLYFKTSITDGLVGLFQPRRSSQEAIRNRVTGGVDGVLTGTPAFTAWGATLGPSAYIDTSIPETSSFTIISVVRKAPGGGVAIVSTLAGSTSSTPYAHLVINNSTVSVRFETNVKTTPLNTSQNFGYQHDDNAFEMIFSSCNGSSITQMMPRNPSGVVGGNPRTVALEGTRDTPNTTWRIGAAKVSTVLYPNSTEHALTLIYNRALTELEGRAIYAEAEAYFAARGVTI